MTINCNQPLYEDRTDAGRRLAGLLTKYKSSQTILMGVACGGVPVAASVGKELDLPWNIIVSHKLPVPWYPQAGFGAMAADCTSVLNEAMLHSLRLSRHKIDDVIGSVKSTVQQQASLYEHEIQSVDINSKTVIVIDDVLKSGYTMLAAIKSVRSKQPEKVVIASPVASRFAANMVESAADDLFFGFVSPAIPFSPSDFYLSWPELSDSDILHLIHNTH